MANRFPDPFPQYLNDVALPYAGGTLTFYVTGTTTLTDTYSDTTLATPNANPITLDSAGRLPVDIFLDPAVTYKVVLKDSGGVTIKTGDPVVDPAANVTAAFQIYNGNPNGNVAGNAGTVGGTGASVLWDTTNDLLYVCTTTGDAATAVWTQVASTFAGAIQFTGIISPASLGANQNDYSPTGLSTAAIIRQNASTDVTITGLQGGAAGRQIEFVNISTSKITLANASTSSSAANRFILDANLVIYPGQSVLIWYDTTSARWRLVGSFHNAPSGVPGGRLTLTSATPVLAADVTAATTIYYAPYIHNYIRLYNGTHWTIYQFSELSQTLADATKSPLAAAVSSVYDLFVWDDSGTLRCTRGPAWSSATSRGAGAGTSELTRVDGCLVNANSITNGPAANRGVYVGTIGTSSAGANGQLNMMFLPAAAAGGSANRLDVWNMYNRVPVQSVVRDSTNSWNYTIATWRSTNNSTSNRCTFVTGDDGIVVHAAAMASPDNGGANSLARIAIGLDSTSAVSGLVGLVNGALGNTRNITVFTLGYSGMPGIGSHFVQQLEYSEANGTTTWYGDNNDPNNFQTGMIVTLEM